MYDSQCGLVQSVCSIDSSLFRTSTSFGFKKSGFTICIRRGQSVHIHVYPLMGSIKYQQSASSKNSNRISNQPALLAVAQTSSSPFSPSEQSHYSNAYSRNTLNSSLIDNLLLPWRGKRPISCQDQQLRLIIYLRCSLLACLSSLIFDRNPPLRRARSQ